MTAGSVTLNAGSGGEDVATDEIAGVAYQRVKLVDGTIDGTDAIQGTAANGLEVDVTRVQGTVTVDGSGVTQPVSGTITANLSATDNAVLDSIAAAQLPDGHNVTVDNASIAVTNAGLTELAAAINTNQLDVNIATDSVGIGGGTEYTEDAAAPANPVGKAGLMERDDALGGITPIEGDWSHQFCNANGALWTAVDGTVTVDGSGVTQPVSGTVTANLGATDNAVLDQIEVNTSYGDNTGNGTAAGALRVTVASDTTGVLSVDDNGGSLTVDGTVTANLGATDNAVLDDIAAHTSDPMTVAHDAAATGAANVNMAGARATNSVEGITQVANADATRLAADLNGVLLTRPHTTPEESISERISNTNGTSTNFSTFNAGGAGIHNYVTDITVLNTSGTDGYVDIRDGSGGSVIWTLPLPANGGATHSFSLPLKGAANTALAYDVSAALTTVYISVNGYQAQG